MFIVFADDTSTFESRLPTRALYIWIQTETHQQRPIPFSVEQISLSAMSCHSQYSLVDLMKHGASTCTRPWDRLFDHVFRMLHVKPLLKISRDVSTLIPWTDVISDWIKPYAVAMHSFVCRICLINEYNNSQIHSMYVYRN